MKTELYTPWSLSDNGERVIDCDGDEVCDLNDGDFSSPRIIEAAARLISAAPDLLEALKAVAAKSSDGFTGCCYCKFTEQAGHSQHCPVGAAIAKATQP